MKGQLRTQELIEKLEKSGIIISKRTIEYYQELGLLPRPLRKKGAKTGGGVLGYYQPNVVDIIRSIHTQKDKGLTLSEIKDNLRDTLFEKYKQHYKEWGVLDSLPHNAEKEKYEELFKESLLPVLVGATDREIERIALLHIYQVLKDKLSKLYSMADYMRNEFSTSEIPNTFIKEFMKKIRKIYDAILEMDKRWTEIGVPDLDFPARHDYDLPLRLLEEYFFGEVPDLRIFKEFTMKLDKEGEKFDLMKHILRS